MDQQVARMAANESCVVDRRSAPRLLGRLAGDGEILAFPFRTREVEISALKKRLHDINGECNGTMSLLHSPSALLDEGNRLLPSGRAI